METSSPEVIFFQLIRDGKRQQAYDLGVGLGLGSTKGRKGSGGVYKGKLNGKKGKSRNSKVGANKNTKIGVNSGSKMDKMTNGLIDRKPIDGQGGQKNVKTEQSVSKQCQQQSSNERNQEKYSFPNFDIGKLSSAMLTYWQFMHKNGVTQDTLDQSNASTSDSESDQSSQDEESEDGEKGGKKSPLTHESDPIVESSVVKAVSKTPQKGFMSKSIVSNNSNTINKSSSRNPIDRVSQIRLRKLSSTPHALISSSLAEKRSSSVTKSPGQTNQSPTPTTAAQTVINRLPLTKSAFRISPPVNKPILLSLNYDHRASRGHRGSVPLKVPLNQLPAILSQVWTKNAIVNKENMPY